MKHYDFEEEFHARDRKQFRKERKLAQSSDRSKFKKTNVTTKEQMTHENTHVGRVLSISGEGSLVDFEEKQYLCSLKGLLKKEKSLTKNLIAVGDRVQFQISSEKEGAIVAVMPRTSILSRTDISGKKEQLIAVNVDLAIICVSIAEPPLKPSLVDRYLIAAEKGNLQPVIVVNKIDLVDEQKELYEEFLTGYEPLGYPIVSISTKTGVGLDALASLLQNKTSVFSGQSGVGKSSLLNACFGLKLKTGELTQKTAKGAHTTTMAELLALPGGGYCVDTPGVRSFGIWNLQKQDVIDHFRELKVQCKFPDCSHTNEPDCTVIKKVENGTISPLRYQSYLTLINELQTQNSKTTWN
ncbi:MAG TPA: ribosome small subunit-dependent GTPase A [Chlamydiales bacterium]|nr:ribosome small subunit-dependent GTPase A [Chlamydiales bacterium]